jgi:hypothetical protein
VSSKADRLVCGLHETAYYDGVAFMVPIFAVSKTSIFNLKDNQSGLTIYDNRVVPEITETEISKNFLYNITLHMLKDKGITVDYVEHISVGESADMRGHRRVVISDPVINDVPLRDVAAKCRMNYASTYSCRTCDIAKECWSNA